jgi:hypothetical protein
LKRQAGKDEDGKPVKDAKKDEGQDNKPPDPNQAQDLLAGLKRNLLGRHGEACFRLPVDHSVDHVDLRQPSLGLPVECMAKPFFRFLLLKPQITFRSEADPDAIILLAVEEFSLKAFRVIDTTAKDNVTAAVLTRYVLVF